MNCPVGLLRPRLISLGITCAMLLGCWTVAHADAHAKGPTQTARLGRKFKLRAGRQVTLPEGLRIKFVAVKEDSRCPADVQCVWAGNAAVRLEVSIRGRGGKSLTLNTNSDSSLADENQYQGYKLKVVDLSPYPRSTQRIAARDYVVTLVVSKDA